MDPLVYIKHTRWVLDTSFLLKYPYVMFEVPGTYILTDEVLRRIDQLQKCDDAEIRAVASKLVSFFNGLMDLTGKSLMDGIELTSRNDPFMRHIKAFSLPDQFVFPAWLSPEDGRDRIIASTLFLTQSFQKEACKGEISVGLATEDDGMRMRARAFGIDVVNPYEYHARKSRNSDCNEGSSMKSVAEQSTAATPAKLLAASTFRFISSALSRSHTNGLKSGT